MVGEAGSGLRAAAGSWALPLSPSQHPLSQRVFRMAGGPPRQPGARVSGGDGEHKESQKNNTNSEAIFCWENPAATVCLSQIRKRKPREGQELARRHTAKQKAAGSGTQACLEDWEVGTHSWA